MKMKRLVMFVAPLLFALSPTARGDTIFLPSAAEIEKIALKHPAPEYPKKLRAKHITGSGLFTIQVDAPTGRVVDVTIDRSTGSATLDKSAVEALRHWAFRPHSVVRVRVPIAFTLPRIEVVSSNQTLQPTPSRLISSRFYD